MYFRLPALWSARQPEKPRLECVAHRRGEAARGAVHMDVGHGFVFFVEDVVGIQAQAQVFADLVAGHQIDGGVGALRQCGAGCGFGYFRPIVSDKALPVEVAVNGQALVDVVAGEEFDQMLGVIDR